MENLTTNELAKEISKNLMLTSMLQKEMSDRFKNVEGYLLIKSVDNIVYIIRKNNNIVEGFGFNGKEIFNHCTDIGLIMTPSYFLQITEEEYNYCANIVKKYETEKLLNLTQYLHDLSKKYDII